MTKKMSTLGKNIMEGFEEAIAHARGEPNNIRITRYTAADAKAIRKRLGMSQSEFASAYSIPLDTLQNWEQGRTNPDRTASAYLWAIGELPQQISAVQMKHRELASQTDMRAY